jgi:hypothetical protein
MFKNKILQKILELLVAGNINEHRRKHLIETMRNICFDYESEIKVLTEIEAVKKLN